MEIERINENTIKFYISYMDIENRGFGREEIWYNRERSEELFWEMMEEVNDKEEFTIEGPLWIQVQAMEKGLEVIVTRANLSKNGDNINLPDDPSMNIPIDQNIAKMLEDKQEHVAAADSEEDDLELVEESMTMMTVAFASFEDVIQLSHYVGDNSVEWHTLNTLYVYENEYILNIEFANEIDSDAFENIVSIIYEFADDTEITSHMLEEYGKKIFSEDVFSQIRSYFPV
ncbi:MAG TPA: adaptor protein MecA [Bacillota bacterium]|nr:adaptor protein MecA [Bacillota bacterium]